MSRDQAIYNQGPLNSTQLSTSTVPGAWDESKLAGQTSGGGFVLEGTVTHRKRHLIQDSTQNKARYVILTLDVKSAFKRQYDPSGAEIEMATGKTKKVSTGYLHSSYKTEIQEASGEVTVAQVRQVWGRTLNDLSKFEPSANLVEIWGEESKIQTLDFENGDSIRVKTRGNSPLVDFIVRLDAANVYLNNFAGDQPADTWTSNIFQKGKVADTKPLPQDTLEGAGDDEWD